MNAHQLFPVDLDTSVLPRGSLKYCSMRFAESVLPNQVLEVLRQMAEGLQEPRISYNCRDLEAGGCFGHGRWHCDGKEVATEIHRLLTIGGTPTEGDEGQVLDAGFVWEYTGKFRHRARPAAEPCRRLMLRISQTEMLYRDHWQGIW
jgi:hypothetical protein